MKKALLLGNGLNRLNRNYSWASLIDDLLQAVDPVNPLQTSGKPFPLLYEEIVQAAHRVGMPESALKKELAKLVERIGPSTLHQELANLGLGEILTTNYDYNVEDVCEGEVQSEDSSESKYSLFRRKTYPDLSVWHIHGERGRPDSILLGYEQYSGYLHHMRNYMTKGHDGRKVKPLRSRIKDGEVGEQGFGWLDFFFNRNLFIIGLTMDYVEMHLWWLITYRARLISLSEFPIANKVTFVYPRFESKRSRSRLQLLTGAGIRLRRIDVENGQWLEFYRRALDLVGGTST